MQKSPWTPDNRFWEKSPNYEKRREKPVETHDPPPLSEAQTWRWIAHARADFWYCHQMPVTPARLTLLVWGTRWGVVREADIPHLSRLIPDIEARAILFPPLLRTNRGPDKIPRIVRTAPPGRPPEIAKLAEESAWSLFARCRSCGCNRFLPITIDAKPHVACYHCLPPLEHDSIGATLSERSLIFEAAEKIVLG